jgi:hypothetical protein
LPSLLFDPSAIDEAATAAFFLNPSQAFAANDSEIKRQGPLTSVVPAKPVQAGSHHDPRTHQGPDQELGGEGKN